MRWFILLLLCGPILADNARSADTELIQLDLNPYKNRTLKCPKIRLLDQVTSDYRPTGTQIDIIGLESLIVSEAKGRIKSAARRQIRTLYEEGDGNYYRTPSEITKEFADIDQTISLYGDWWDRRWYESMPVEKGGLTTTTIKIGHEVHVPPQFHLINHIKQKISKIWIYDDDRRYDSLPGINNQSQLVQTSVDPQLLPDSIRIEVTSAIEHRRITSDFSFRLKVRPAIKTDSDSIVGEIALKTIVELYYRKTHYGNITLLIEHNFGKAQSLASISFELISW